MTGARLVIFDLDGTLIDSAALMVESVRAAFDGVGLTAPGDVAIRSVSGLGLADGLARLVPDLDAEAAERIGKLYRAEYLERATLELREPLFPGALEVLERLSRRDDTLLAVATGKALRGASRVLNMHEIDELFVSVHTPDDHVSKPDPEMIHAAMAQAGAEPRATVMVGDTNHDMEMASAAEVGALGVSWGYHDVDELHTAGADRVIDDFSEMETALDEMLDKANA